MFREVAVAVLSLALGPVLRAQAAECVGSVPITTFRLSASPSRSGSPVWMPIRQINNLPSGYRIRYQPGAVPADMGKDAAVALWIVPKTGDGQMQVLAPAPAASSTEWNVPFDVSVVILVFAPQGFDEKRLTNLMTRDPALVSALAEYADQTNDLEATLEALRDLDDDTEAALEPGRASTPTELALLALVRALNPAVSSYDPFGSGRRAGPTSMMGRGANLFFENAGGVVPGGEILPAAKQFLMPDTEFRSVYGAGAEAGSMTLCAQRQARTRNKVAYVWAYRLTNAPAPNAQIVATTGEIADVPIGIRAGVTLKLPAGKMWELLNRVTDWGLVSPAGGAPLHIEAHPSAATRELRLDLRNFSGLPGVYGIEGRWDWGAVRLKGSVRLHKLDDLTAATLTPESQDNLVIESGPVALDLTGANLRFIQRAWIHRPESERQIPVDLPVKRDGPADHLRVEVNTDGLHPGSYQLALLRVDGATTDIPVQILTSAPRIDSTNLRLNAGEPAQTILLQGADLDRIDALESPLATIELRAPNKANTQREAVVRLRPATLAGADLQLAAKVAGRKRPLPFPGVLQVVPAKPHITDARAAAPQDLLISLHDGEIPAGSFVSFTLRYEGAAKPSLSLKCDGAPAASPQMYTVPAPGTLFFAADPGTIGNTGCKLAAIIESQETGASEPFPLGNVVRVPHIEKFTVTNDPAPGGYVAILEGWDLESIERTGWNATLGLPSTELPRSIAGQGAKQTLRIAMPWPSPTPKSPLFVFLRGESQGRVTHITQ
jgi:hypothetical protein